MFDHRTSRCILNLNLTLTQTYIWFREEDSKSKKAHTKRKTTVYNSPFLQQSTVIAVEQKQKCHRDLESVKMNNLQCVNQENLQCVKLNTEKSVGL